jgi:hypothetical protein
MTPGEIIRGAAGDGVSLTLSPAGTIKAVGDRAAVSRWLPVLREHKPALLAALAAPAVTEEGVDASRQDWGAMSTLALLQAAEAAGMAMRLDGDALVWDIYSGSPPGLWNAIRSRKAEILAHANATKQGAATRVSPEFAARLSPEDLQDIASGAISPETVQAYAQMPQTIRPAGELARFDPAGWCVANTRFGSR